MESTAVTNGVDARVGPAAGLGKRDYEGLTRADLLRMYRWMLTSRRFDDKELQLKNQSRILFHISGAGHEAILVAAASVLRAGYDWFFPYYRDRALCLALGYTVYDMFLGSFAAESDLASGGRMMSSHWGHAGLNIVPGSSATGTQCVEAVGCAEATLIYGTLPGAEGASPRFHGDEVTYVSLGDGATGEGEFWESLSTACAKRLPLIYVVEDNGYAISCPTDVHTPGGDIARLVESFPNLRVIRVDGTDVVASHRAMREAATYARAHNGPVLVRARLVRLYSHSHSDDQRAYKTPEELEAEARRDPILVLKRLLLDEALATEEELAGILLDVDAEIAEAADRASRAPRPAAETAGLWVYSPDGDPTSSAFTGPSAPDGKQLTMVAAINRTLSDEMARNPRMVVFGQDVADASHVEILDKVSGKGGVFKATLGLQRAYGSDRVFNTSLAEANMVGRALGMSVRGLKPVCEIQFFDYIWPAMMQIRDEVTLLRYRTGNHFACPMVIRAPIGGYLRGGGVYHSQCGESIFAHCPGLRIAFPSTAEDTVGLLRTAIRCDDPVLFLEHKHLYRQTYNRGEYPGPDFMIPFGKAAMRRDGNDLVIVTWGALVQRSLVAAQQAEREGIQAAVLDLRTIAPYDWEAVANAVRRTSRVIVAHEDMLTCGFGAEIAARIAEELFGNLDAPVTRIGAMDTPVAFSPELEEAILPQTNDILRAIRNVAGY
jgi:2-oxoisovalerate dehydrogenase E1 component